MLFVIIKYLTEVKVGNAVENDTRHLKIGNDDGKSLGLGLLAIDTIAKKVNTVPQVVLVRTIIIIIVITIVSDVLMTMNLAVPNIHHRHLRRHRLEIIVNTIDTNLLLIMLTN